VIAVALGVAQLVSSALHWHLSDARLFSLYLCLSIGCSYFQLRGLAGGTLISLNLPFILLAIVQLDRPEAVVVSCAGMLAQSLWNPQTRSKPLHIALTTGIVANVIATAEFAYTTLIPHSLQSETLRLIVASLTLFVSTTFPSAMLLRLNQDKRLGRLWKEFYFWSIPYYLIAAAIAKASRLAVKNVSLESTLFLLPILYLAYRYYLVQKSHLEQQEKYAGDMAALHLRAIEGLALAVEARHNLNTQGHLRRVQVYALGIGKELNLSRGEMEALHAAALLHDIGKLAIPEHILTKPGKLTPEEFVKMKVHPLVGSEIVEQVRFPYPVAPLVGAHHEKWDGSGYPYGLKGEEIPLGARILSAADCLDALTSDREYRRGMSLEEAVSHIVSEAGKSFDPKVVEVLQRHYYDLDVMARSGTDQPTRLSTNVVVEKGKSTDAGLDLTATLGLVPGIKSSDFIGPIAAARRELQMQIEILEGISSTLDLNEILHRVEQSLRSVIPFDAFVIFTNRNNTLTAQHATGDNNQMLARLEVPLGEGLSGWVAQNERTVINGNPAVEPGFTCAPDRVLNACLAVPLQGPAGQLGVIALYRRVKDSFTQDHLRILTDVAPRIGVAVDNALKFREMEARANTDVLTGLPNSQVMMEVLESELGRAKRQGQDLSVALCSLSGLPAVQQSLGQPAVDHVLRHAAQRMRETCRQYDHVARVGEDRFGFVLPGMRPQDMEGKTARLNAIVAESAEKAGGPGMVGLQLAKACYPEDADGAKSLMAIAERRLEQETHAAAKGILALDALVREDASQAQFAPAFR